MHVSGTFVLVDQAYLSSHAHRADHRSGRDRLNDDLCLREHTEIRWVDPEELGEYDFPEADRAVIEKLMEL